MAKDPDGTRFDEAIIWFAYGIYRLHGEELDMPKSRPWSRAFDLAEKRSDPKTADYILRDWLCDDIWSLDWIERASWDKARFDWVTRYEIAQELTAVLISSGSREDRAAAEAIMIIELAGESPMWEEYVKKFDV